MLPEISRFVPFGLHAAFSASQGLCHAGGRTWCETNCVALAVCGVGLGFGITGADCWACLVILPALTGCFLLSFTGACLQAVGEREL